MPRGVSREQFSLYGHKFLYQTFLDGLSAAGLQPEFFQIEILDRESITSIIFRLPSGLAESHRQIEAAIMAADDVDYFTELGYTTYEIKYCDHPLGNGRKVCRVLDRRRL